MSAGRLQGTPAPYLASTCTPNGVELEAGANHLVNLKAVIMSRTRFSSRLVFGTRKNQFHRGPDHDPVT